MVILKVASAIEIKCTWIEMPLVTIRVEKPTPQIPPVLHKPCIEPMIFFSNLLCKVIACVLTAILKIRILKANKQIDTIKADMEVEKPIHASETALAAKARAKGIRLSYLETSHPEKGKPIKEVSGIANKIVPSSASFKSKNVLIVGILEAQVAKLNPEIKKKILRKIRWVFFETMLYFIHPPFNN